METALKIALPLLRKMLIPVLGSIGAFIAGRYSAEFTAFCAAVL